mmetsp:Transcript_10845/g.30477  ORF Transcript_10845/g.30477 Transcript_10845/m.30477 type:complete len:205 (-) Transcript_10845:1468-2082(-)
MCLTFLPLFKLHCSLLHDGLGHRKPAFCRRGGCNLLSLLFDLLENAREPTRHLDLGDILIDGLKESLLDLIDAIIEGAHVTILSDLGTLEIVLDEDFVDEGGIDATGMPRSMVDDLYSQALHGAHKLCEETPTGLALRLDAKEHSGVILDTLPKLLLLVVSADAAIGGVLVLELFLGGLGDLFLCLLVVVRDSKSKQEGWDDGR